MRYEFALNQFSAGLFKNTKQLENGNSEISKK